MFSVGWMLVLWFMKIFLITPSVPLSFHKFIGYVQLPESCNILLTEKWIVSIVERNRDSQAMSSEYVVESTDCQWL